MPPMKKIFSICLLALAGACAAPSVDRPTVAAAPNAVASTVPTYPQIVTGAPPPAMAQAAIAPIAGPALTTRAGQRELEVIMYFFSGRYELAPSKYLPARFNEPAVAHIAPFWTDRTPGEHWLYMEFARRADEAHPIMQRVYRLREAPGVSEFQIAVYRLPGNSLDFAGEWRKEKPFEKLALGDLTELPECRIKFTRNVVAFYVGGTLGARCRETPDTPADHEHTEFKLSSSNFHVFAQGFDAQGRQISGPPGPVEYRKMSGNWR
jgi:hypothetical protein